MGFVNQEFDFVVIGAGSSGCAVASELARKTQCSVLLIEAGGQNKNPLIKMPRGYAALWTKPEYYWNFPVNHKPGWPADDHWYYGKGLGGSSAVNGTWYFRGQPQDYDSWEAMGLKEWNWKVMAGIYETMENFPEADSAFGRGKNGPVEVTTVQNRTPLTESIIEAGNQFGAMNVKDVNQSSKPVVGYTQMTVNRHGNRVSAYNAFIENKHYYNLTVRSDLFVNKIIFSGLKATGVACKHSSGFVNIRATKSVILCAGVLNSPKLLQLSGIGEPELLSRFKINVVKAQPNVGQNMAEHMMAEVRYRLKNTPGMNREFRGWRLYKNVLSYYLTKSGAMAYGLPEVSAMLASEGASAEWPDLQLGFSLATFDISEEGKAEPGRGSTEKEPGMSVVGFVLRPKSRGSVAIQSASVTEPVVVNPNWLSHPEDEEAMVSLINTVRRYMSQSALIPFIECELLPTSNAKTDAEIKALLPDMLRSGLHGTGTCRMGTEENGVVDSRLRVHGVQNLRIADCSVMPTSISGNTNGPAMALGIRAAQLIIEDLDI